MAVIGSIRKQSGLLIVLIGAAMVLFLLSDLFSNGGGLFSQQETTVGTIAGDDIDQQEFELRVQQVIDEQYGPDGASEELKTQIRESIWQQLVSEKIVEVEHANLGLYVSANELLDQVKNTQPGSLLYQYFTDRNTGQIYQQFQDPQTGMLDSKKVLQYIQQVLASENAKSWLPMEKAIKQDVASRKYTTLLQKGLFVSTPELNQQWAEKSTAHTAKFAVIEFNTIADSTIKPTDDDLRAYYNDHKHEAQFQVEVEERSLLQVTLQVAPSDADKQALKDELAGLVPLFQADTNDSVFVAEYADSPLAQLIVKQKKEALFPDLQDTVSRAALGSVFGPYEMGRSMVITKLIGTEMAPDSVRASHILIKLEGADSAKIAAAKAKIDSLQTVAKAKKNFADLATTFSEDVASAVKGGDLDWFTRGRMVPEFEAACFSGKKGDYKVVETTYGVHLIYITDQTAPKPLYLLASVDRAIDPSKATSDAVYKEASNLAGNNPTLEAFEKIGEPYTVMPADGLRLGQESVPGLGQAEAVVRWAYEAEVGQVSEPIELDNRYVVAVLAQVNEVGQMSFENAKKLIEPEVIKLKKAEKFIAQFGTYSDVFQAAENAKVQVMDAPEVRFANNNMSGSLGFEPKVLGTVVALNERQVSKPIVGNRGVFVVANAGEAIDAAEMIADDERRMSMEQLGLQAENRALEALKKVRGVTDNRSRFY